MQKKGPPCLKRFGFLPKEKYVKPKKIGRKPSERFYLNESGAVYLTTREFEVSVCIAAGCTVREAAKRLNLSPRTAEFYLANVRHKLGVRSKQELLRVLFDNNFFRHL